MGEVAKDDPRRCSTVHHDDRHVTELDLIDVAMSLSPFSVLFCCVVFNVCNVTDHWQTCWTVKGRYPRLFADHLIDEHIYERNKKRQSSKRSERV